MGRQAAHRIRQLAALAFLGLASCQTVPASVSNMAGDAAVAAVDAATLDAAVDSAVVDSAVVDAALPDASVNPNAITLEDVTNTLARSYIGGSKPANPWGAGSGAAIGDLDGDGDLDIVLARCDADTGGPTTLLRQAGTPPSYATLIEDAGFASQFAGTCAHAVALGDMDNDGDLDIFVALDGPDRLLRNEGGGTFVDISTAAGIVGPANDVSVGAVWADVNRDGLLDLYVLSHTNVVPPVSSPSNANRLYINLADGSFREIGVSSGAAGDGSSQVALISDLDNDGMLEIYVANDKFAIDGSPGNSSLEPDAFLDAVSFDAEGMPTYANRSAAYNTDGPRSAMGLALADLNDDGFDDIFVSDWGTNHIQMWNPALGRYQDQHQWWNLGSRANPWELFYVSWGARFMDLDRDGAEELFVANGHVQPAINCTTVTQLNLFLRRVGVSNQFQDIAAEVGLPAAYNCPEPADIMFSTRGVVVGDLDGDGDDDLLLTPFNEKYRFHRNNSPTSGRHWLRVRPIGTVSAPDPAGLILEVELADGTVRKRRLYAGGDTYSQSDRVIEVGLGSVATVVQATLHWPSGFSQRIDTTAGFAVDTELRIREPTWLGLSSRLATMTGPATTLRYEAVASNGAPLGAAGVGRTVTVTRSDGVSTIVTDNSDGTYTATLPHPGSARITVLTVTVDGVVQNARLTIHYK